MTLSDLRIQSIHRNTPVTIWVNGRKVSTFEGELLHAALVAAGFRQLRKSVSGTEHRGFFCGMGVCYECLLTIDDMPQQRACVMEVYDGMRVEIDAI
ncbi:MAG: (2Fe-2S)-binding protein [Desulfosarcina sp.]|nr:(2Fe-2S)-binding protein [Desulfobacterales bacterium]